MIIVYFDGSYEHVTTNLSYDEAYERYNQLTKIIDPETEWVRVVNDNGIIVDAYPWA